MRAAQEELTNTSTARKKQKLYIGIVECKHLHPQACMYALPNPHMCKHTYAQARHYSVQLQKENPILSITCYSRWNLAYTGVEGKKICFLFSPLQTKIPFFSLNKVYYGVCVCTSLAQCALLLLVPWVCDHVSLAGRERAGTPDCSSPELTPDPGVHGGAPLPLLRAAVCFPHWNRIPTFVMLSGVFTPILPKPIE